MTSDRIDALLSVAADAARRRADAGVADGAATRLALREALAGGAGRRRRRLTIIAALIASLFGSTAFALVTRARRASEPVAPAPVVAPAIDEPAAAAPPIVRPLRVREQVTLVRPALPPPVRPVPRAPTAHALAAQPTVELPAPRSSELAAYRVAHEAHFRGGDPAAALAAWDAYLARYPDGELAPEARYDRALVLIKLRRFDEARAALAPFATAPAGSYRQREAARLLGALRGQVR